MKTLIAILALCAAAHAREISFAWDKPVTPVDGHIIFTKQPDGNWVNVGEVKVGEEYAGAFPDGDFEIAISAFRWIKGSTDRLQSERSLPLTIPKTIAIPTGLRVRVLVEVQTK